MIDRIRISAPRLETVFEVKPGAKVVGLRSEFALYDGQKAVSFVTDRLVATVPGYMTYEGDSVITGGLAA